MATIDIRGYFDQETSVSDGLGKLTEALSGDVDSIPSMDWKTHEVVLHIDAVKYESVVNKLKGIGFTPGGRKKISIIHPKAEGGRHNV